MGTSHYGIQTGPDGRKQLVICYPYTTPQDQLKHPANFLSDGKLYLVRCVSCGGERGRENWSGAAATGSCAWCGWGSVAAS